MLQCTLGAPVNSTLQYSFPFVVPSCDELGHSTGLYRGAVSVHVANGSLVSACTSGVPFWNSFIPEPSCRALREMPIWERTVPLAMSLG